MFSNKRSNAALKIHPVEVEKEQPKRTNTLEALQSVVVSTTALEAAIVKSRAVSKFAEHLKKQAAAACLELDEVK